MPARAFHPRPLVVMALALGAGVALDAQRLPVWLLGLLMGVFALAAALFHARGWVALTLAACACMALGMLRMNLMRASLPSHDPPQGWVMLTARVDDIPQYTHSGWRIPLSQAEAGGVKLTSRVLLTLPDEGHSQLIAYGDTLLAAVELQRPSSQRNPGGPDWRTMMAAQGYGYQAYAKPETLVLQRGETRDLKGLVLRLRNAVERSLFANMKQEYAGIYRAVLLGDKSTLDDETYAAFRETGIAHLLAVSGLHVGGMAMLLAFVLRKLKCRPMAVFGVTCAFLLLYSAMAGFSASVSRASLMTLLMLLGRARGRPVDTLTSLAAACILLLLVNPMQLYAVGFQLSFGAVFGLLTLSGPLQKIFSPLAHMGKVGRWIQSALAATLAATLGTLPTTATVFGEMSVSSLLANMVAIPLAAPLVALGLATALTGLAWPTLGLLLGQAAELLMRALLWCVGWLRRMGMVALPAVPLWLALGCFALALLISGYCLLKKRAAVVAAFAALLLAACAVAPLLRPTPVLEVVVLDVGQGNSAIVRAGKRTLVIDTGDARSYDYGERVVWPALRALGVTRVDSVMLTHAHSDHAGGLASLLARVKVDSVVMPRMQPNSDTRAVLDTAADHGVPVSETRGETVYDLGGGVTLGVLQGEGEGAYERSMAFILGYDGPFMLMTGDMGMAQEEALLPYLEGPCPVIEAGHHGSRNATSEALLEAARPAVAVISVGRNSYGHPSPETLARIEKAGAVVLRTDKCGAITLRITDDGMGFTTKIREENTFDGSGVYEGDTAQPARRVSALR